MPIVNRIRSQQVLGYGEVSGYMSTVWKSVYENGEVLYSQICYSGNSLVRVTPETAVLPYIKTHAPGPVVVNDWAKADDTQ